MFVPCQIAMLDAATGRASAIGIMEMLTSPEVRFDISGDDVPEAQLFAFRSARLALPSMMFLISWFIETVETQTFEAGIFSVAPDGQEVQQARVSVNITANYNRLYHQHPPIAARMPGIYEFVLKARISPDSDWTEQARYPIALDEVPQEAVHSDDTSDHDVVDSTNN